MEGKNFLFYQLYSIYGELLTVKQRESIEDYFGLDLSLGEIAEMRGVTRQAVKYALDSAEKALLDYEEKLGFYKKLNQIKDLNCSSLKKEGVKQAILKILEDR